MPSLPSTPAIVLAMHTTGLAAARCLADGGVTVYGVSTSTSDLGRRSKRLNLVDLAGKGVHEHLLGEWLYGYAKELGGRPVVLPASDEQALELARHHAQLDEVCRISSVTPSDYQRIVSKEGLYGLGEKTGVRVPPMVIEPSAAELRIFCDEHIGPYLAKPYYNGVSNCALREKNRVFPDGPSLLAYAEEYGTTALIIQRLIAGGDGWIFDAYGLCRRDGSIAVLASHRRIRQHPRGLGATSYGEIPAAPRGLSEDALFERTRKLLSGIRYHGIFGIEWLHERATGELYLIDFNARPFLSIGHLKDCGLNLPVLAFRELHDDPLDDVDPLPTLEHRYWMNVVPDLRSVRRRCLAGEMTWREWVNDVRRATSFAAIDTKDIGPALYQSRELAGIGLRYAVKRAWSRIVG